MPREPIAEHLDEYEHFGNRRLRTVGELIQEAFRIGLYRMERVVRERLTTEDADTITPQTIVNIRPVVAALKEFFGSCSSPVHGPDELAGRADAPSPSVRARRRRPDARARADRGPRRAPDPLWADVPDRDARGSEHRPDRLALQLAEVSEYGFVTTPYRVVQDGVVTDEIVRLDATQEEERMIAQANTPVDAKTGKLQGDEILCRTQAGQYVTVGPKDVDLVDVSPEQIWSVATAMIPFLEHDDANRALMGSNMQPQAVPLLITDAPLVGTGMERRAALDTGDVVISRDAGHGRLRRRRPDRRSTARTAPRTSTSCRSSCARTRAR